MHAESDPRKTQEIFSLLAEHTGTKSSGAASIFSGWDGGIFAVFGSSFLLCLIFAIVAALDRSSVRVLWILFLIFLSLGILSYLVLLTHSVFIWLKLMGRPVASFLVAHTKPITRDYNLVAKLRGFPGTELKFVSARLHLEADHLRGRLGILIGALDKVGIIPLVAGGVGSFWKFRQDNPQFKPSYLEICLSGLGLFYFMGMVITITSHRIDELAQITESAISDASTETEASK
jgi:hypothetical protein